MSADGGVKRSWIGRIFGTRSSSPTAARPPFERDANGRAIRPRIETGPVPDETSSEVRELMLDWAIAWVGEPIEDRTRARELLDAWLGGRPPARKADRIAAVAMAVHAVRTSCQEARARRTAAAFPYAEIRLGPQVDPCACATAIAGQVIPFSSLPVLPLAGCSSPICSCWFRQITKAEHQRRAVDLT